MRVIIVRGRAIDSAVYKLASALSQNDNFVKLLVWDRQNTLGDGHDARHTIYRFKLRAPYDNLIVLFYFPIWWIYEFFFLLRNESDVIHACDLDTLLPAILAKRIRRVKLCYTIYDFYADNLPDGNLSLLRRLIRSLVARIERLGIGFAEVLFLVDESRYEQVKAARIRKLVYAYNSPPDCLEASPEPEFKSTPEITLFYAGVIHKSRGLEYMMRAIEDLDNIKLVIAGTGPHRETVDRISRQNRNVQYIAQVPYDEVLRKTSEADILFAFYDPAIPNSRYASPNKLFEAMMCRKPIIVSAGGSMANIVSEENCGLIIPYGNVDAIKEAIIKLRDDPDLRQRLGENGRRAYDEKYSWNRTEKRLISAYKEI